MIQEEYPGSIIVNTKTQDEHDRLMTHLLALGYIDTIGMTWHGSESCIRIPPDSDSEKRLNYSSADFYRTKCNCKVISMDEYMGTAKKPMKEENLNCRVIQALRCLQLEKG